MKVTEVVVLLMLSLSTVYLFAAFVQADLNAFAWDIEDRMTTVLFAVILTIVAFVGMMMNKDLRK